MKKQILLFSMLFAACIQASEMERVNLNLIENQFAAILGHATMISVDANGQMSSNDYNALQWLNHIQLLVNDIRSHIKNSRPDFTEPAPPTSNSSIYRPGMINLSEIARQFNAIKNHNAIMFSIRSDDQVSINAIDTFASLSRMNYQLHNIIYLTNKRLAEQRQFIDPVITSEFAPINPFSGVRPAPKQSLLVQEPMIPLLNRSQFSPPVLKATPEENSRCQPCPTHGRRYQSDVCLACRQALYNNEKNSTTA